MEYDDCMISSKNHIWNGGIDNWNNRNVEGVTCKKSPYDSQVGGVHYKTPIQPVQYIKANNLNFNQGNIVKYISRYKQKNGLKDLEKIIQYVLFEAYEEYPDEYVDFCNKVNKLIGDVKDA